MIEQLGPDSRHYIALAAANILAVRPDCGIKDAVAMAVAIYNEIDTYEVFAEDTESGIRAICRKR